MNRKLKLALGLSFGAIVSTAAITTMAVSCGGSSDQNNAGSTTSTYNPSSAISNKISKADIDKMNVNAQNMVEQAKRGLEAKGYKIDKVNASVKVDGDNLILNSNMSATTQDGKHMAQDITTTYTLVPNKEGKYLISTVSTGNIDGQPTMSKDPISEYLPFDQFKQRIEDIYNGAPFMPVSLE